MYINSQHNQREVAAAARRRLRMQPIMSGDVPGSAVDCCKEAGCGLP